jgi:hypothetical protein
MKSSNPNIPAYNLGRPVGSKSTDGDWPKKETAGRKTMDTPSKMNSGPPVATGIEMQNPEPLPMKIHKAQRPANRPDEDYLKPPTKRKLLDHQRPGQIKAVELRPTEDSD